ncbi:hypothetical protein [Microvirga guangxiensis]|uniref:Uncharacterized protein n=1 Tax=Microvirga guangxiensis TaxID=549386 RepID=A0A1G5F5P4_9HYPH|nr:hypothetical protein [Microvirga guangxiensis]SCY34220.1 hypothetical protein SAMN02927923_01218 [Microvirga guangxiensis]
MSYEDEDDIYSTAPRLVEAAQRDAGPTDYVVVINEDGAPAMVHPTLWPHAFPDEEAMLSAVLEEVCHYTPSGGDRVLEDIAEHLRSVISKLRGGSLDYMAAAGAINEKSSGAFSIVWWGPVSALLTCNSEFARELRDEIVESEEEVTLERVVERIETINFA